jgi:hypothetical protein
VAGCRALTSERNEIIEAARRSFAFLPTSRPPELDESTDRSVLVYSLADVILEVEFDWREGAVFVLVARPENGGRPGGYYMHEGQRVRRQLTDVLSAGDDDQKVLAQRIRAATRGSGTTAMRAQVTANSEALQAVVHRDPQRLNRAFSRETDGGPAW